MTVATMTAEERQNALAKARIAQKAKQAARKASKLRRDFDMDEHWRGLAKARGLKLPPYGEPATVGSLRSWLRRLSLTQSEYETEIGCKLSEYIAWNAQWPLRALAGVALEHAEERRKD